MKIATIIVALLATSAASATGKPHEQPSTTAASATSHSDSRAVGIGAAQAAASTGPVSATGGNGIASAEGGGGGSSDASSVNSLQQTSTGGEANNEGNSLAVSTHVQRSAPSLGQGGLYNSGCGAGVNGGGSGPGGAGFLGATWTTHDCYLFLLAQRYEAIGMVDTACDVLNSTRAAKKAFRELKMDAPNCAIRQVQYNMDHRPAVPKPPTNVVVFTPGELEARDKKILETATRK